MSKLAELLAEIADEEDLDEEDLESLLEVVKRSRRKANGGGRALARRSEEPPAEFPVGPNHARAITRRGGQSLDTSRSNDRGMAMYGSETPGQAHARWLDQERHDAEGVYGPGGGTAGGIFGEGPVHMADYDPSAQRRTEAAQGGVAMARVAVVLEKLMDRMESLESRSDRALHGTARKRLRGKPSD